MAEKVQPIDDRLRHWDAELKDVNFILHSLVDSLLRNGFDDMANELNQSNIGVNLVRRLIQTEIETNETQ